MVCKKPVFLLSLQSEYSHAFCAKRAICALRALLVRASLRFARCNVNAFLLQENACEDRKRKTFSNPIDINRLHRYRALEFCHPVTQGKCSVKSSLYKALHKRPSLLLRRVGKKTTVEKKLRLSGFKTTKNMHE